MALNAVTQVLGAGLDLIPHIEEGAFRYTMRNFAMPSRVTVYSDMSGFNVRKISEYIPTRRAQELAEDTAIPDHIINRVRKAEIEPKEVGDRYRISDRRSDTDLENIVSDTIMFLGYAIGAQKEADLIDTALNTFAGGTLSATDYSIDLAIQAQFEFKQQAWREQIYHVIHPFQAMKVMRELATFYGTDAGVNMNFREQALRGFTVPAFDNLNIVVSEMLPRTVKHRVKIYGTGGTFRLEIGTGQEVGVNITAPITVAGASATATNIANALNALTGQSGWTCVDGGGGLTDLEVQAPIALDAESELRVAIDTSNPTLPNYASDYDLVTGLSGNPTDPLGNDIGVEVEEISATAKSLFFHRSALVYDIRQPVTAFQEMEHQGRTLEISAYEKYGVGGWRSERGMFISTNATSPLAVS